ncbi:MAG: cyclic nucleotide-binding domain-containing protein [Candidatus Sericytochromatia bacterium]|nr:cyclic nucleotide-binding domain-containing protein [Candidatus Sericytochromatia bacterium]
MLNHARLQMLPAFMGLSAAELDALFAIAERVTAKAGQAVIRTGDEADAFFMLVEGRLEVRVQDMAVATIAPGQLVGEMPLIQHDTERRADVVAVSDAKLYRFMYAGYQALSEQDPKLGRTLRSNLGRVVATREWASQSKKKPEPEPANAQAPKTGKFAMPKPTGISEERAARLERIRRHPVFSGLTDEQRLALESVARVVPLAEGMELFQTGDPATSFLLILEGQLEVSVIQNGRPFALARLGPDQIVGETALIQSKPVRSATVTAVAASKALVFLLEDYARLVAAEPGIGQRLRQNIGRVAASRTWSMH